jgi:hypothetical protein
MRLLLVVVVACASVDAAPDPIGVPVDAREKLDLSIPVPEVTGTLPLDLRHLGAVTVGYAIGVDLAWRKPNKTGESLDVELVGPGVSEKIVIVLADQNHRVIFKTRPKAEGDYTVTARSKTGERQIKIRVMASAAVGNTAHVPIEGDYRLVARGFVRGTVAGEAVVIQRGRFDRGNASLIVDVANGVQDPAAIEKLVRSLGTPRKRGGHTYYVKQGPGNRVEVMWPLRTGTSTATQSIRITAPQLRAAELRVIDVYLARYAPLPAPLQITPNAPKRCTANAKQCCLADGRLIEPEGCQPSYHKAPGPFERGPDGFCKPVPCTLRCLSADASIATPDGDRAVSALRPGDRVWTASPTGERVATTILRVLSQSPTGPHELLEFTLSDGRVVRASGGHPDAQARMLGALRLGDSLDGARIVTIRRIPYAGATWDLEPAGSSGAYWADDVRLGSTLR